MYIAMSMSCVVILKAISMECWEILALLGYGASKHSSLIHISLVSLDLKVLSGNKTASGWLCILLPGLPQKGKLDTVLIARCSPSPTIFLVDSQCGLLLSQGSKVYVNLRRCLVAVLVLSSRRDTCFCILNKLPKDLRILKLEAVLHAITFDNQSSVGSFLQYFQELARWPLFQHFKPQETYFPLRSSLHCQPAFIIKGFVLDGNLPI